MATPVLANESPTPASTIAPAQVLSFDITSTPALARTILSVGFPGIPTEEVVWTGSDFTSPYAAHSARTAISGGFTFRIRRDAVWPDNVILRLYAVNTSAEELLTTWTYSLQVPSTYTPSTNPGTLPTFPLGSPATGSDSGSTNFDQDHFLDLFQRIIDPDYLRAMQLNAGSGYELFQAFAAVGARVSLATQKMEDGLTYLFSESAALAQGVVELYRDTDFYGAVTVKKGTIVATNTGRRFYVQNDAVFGSAELGPKTVRVIGLIPSKQYNVPGTSTTPGGITLDGEIDTVYHLVEDPQYGDPTIKVRQISETQNGRDGMLELLAKDRGVYRRYGESDDQLRYRARSLPDTVTPAAVVRLATTLLQQYGAGFDFIETYEKTYQLCYDAPRTGAYSKIFVYDDPRATYPFTNRWLDSLEHRKAFIIVAGATQPIQHYGGMFDDTAMAVGGLTSSISRGRRTPAAYDHVASDAGIVAENYLQWCWDGRDYRRDALYSGLWENLQQIKAAGIAAIVELKGE